MCAEYGRKKAGKKTRTGMHESQLREFCMKRVKRKHNPHLSGSRDFVGIYGKAEIKKIRRLLTISGIRGIKITSLKDGAITVYELYVAKGRYQLSAIRQFIRFMQEKGR